MSNPHADFDSRLVLQYRTDPNGRFYDDPFLAFQPGHTDEFAEGLMAYLRDYAERKGHRIEYRLVRRREVEEVLPK